ncbi:hypothetical protein [Ensifer aridi]|nr:hypothetical protein [Ensifer aridi]
MGTGYGVRTTGEIVLVGTLGNPKQAHVPAASQTNSMTSATE